ncbi:MAG TPA: SprT-like domain-containing protein [Pseudogracilibacillus sp.]|nr:SprT-like domain-containing protein [Pseudogracilibacillus sp.]
MHMETLEKFAAHFLQEHYHISLSIPVERNNRLKSTHGRFVMKNNRPQKIELAGHLLNYGAVDYIYGVLKHECIHYALFVLGKGHMDGDPVFEAELKKYHAPMTRTLKIGNYIVFTCDHCGNRIETRRKRVAKHPEDYRTACCGSPLTVVGEKVYNGTE